MQGTEDTGPAGERAGAPGAARGAEGVAPGQDPAGGQDAARAQDDQAHRPGHPAAARPHEDHGPVRYGPPAPDPGLPVLPELAAVLAAAGRLGPVLREA
ncbi:pyridoxal phosphate-dependent aminotransferase, partial [Streptomyces sp. MBT60]|nr:pyridoxal phosphate-dependent aminotransferase [Streptomyces sp. MBT60]